MMISGSSLHEEVQFATERSAGSVTQSCHVTGKSGDLKEEVRDLHLETAEMRSELNKNRVENSLINDEVDGID